MHVPPYAETPGTPPASAPTGGAGSARRALGIAAITTATIPTAAVVTAIPAATTATVPATTIAAAVTAPTAATAVIIIAAVA